MTLLVSLVAVVAAAGVTGLRKDVQKTACLSGSALNGDRLHTVVGNKRWDDETEVCQPFTTKTINGVTKTDYWESFTAGRENVSFPY